jgi:uncharacterized protein (DUF1778 family)
MSRYNKTESLKTEICKIRLTSKQKDALKSIAQSENKTITRIVIESLTQLKKIA